MAPSTFDITSASSPSTPDNATPVRALHPGFQRSFTVPTKLTDPSRPWSSSPSSPTTSPSAGSIETLFVHPVAKVVSFSTSPIRPTSSSGTRSCSDATTRLSNGLSWSSPSERTLAAGPLKLYRVPSSGVSFLNSGSLLHPILRRSQCWCVDGKAKFVLRVRDGSFYRIELPATSAEDMEKTEEFKAVLTTILHFEKTPSPFGHGYTEIPQRPRTPPIRRQSSYFQPAKKWRLNKVWEPEDAAQEAPWPPVTPPRALSSPKQEAAASTGAEESSTQVGESLEGEEDNFTEGSVTSVQEGSVPLPLDGSASPTPTRLAVRLRPAQARSITAPHLTLQTAPTPVPTFSSRPASRDTDTNSAVSSHDSFFSTEASSSPSRDADSFHSLDSVDELLCEHPAMTNFSSHKRQVSELTAMPGTPAKPLRTTGEEPLLENLQHDGPATPSLIHDSDDSDSLNLASWSDDAVTPPNTLRLRNLHRHNTSHNYARGMRMNPFSPRAAPTRAKLLTAALVQKAYSLLIGPPAHLAALMLEIASRIMKGINVLYDPLGRKQRLPGSWEDSSSEEDDRWNEDDFGIPLHHRRRLSSDASFGAHSPGVD